jgi:hypothetical protein
MSSAPFPPASRYHSIPFATWVAPDGREIVHLRRRFLPRPTDLATVREHPVSAGDRLDLIAAEQLGDSGAWWQVADANGAIDPAPLTAEPGRVLRIALPGGLPGMPVA